MAQTILIVDDEASMRTMLKEYLIEQGFRVETAPDGRQALFVARQTLPDLILLDIMMPEMDGYEFIRNHRPERKTPIILLTARLDETDKVVGLELGADDYVTKPFSMRELVARIRAVIRRAQSGEASNDVLHTADVLLDRSRHHVEISGTAVDLTPTEFELLATLMTSPGRVYSRAQLLEQLHSFAIEGTERTIDVHIRNLRAKVEPDPGAPIYIETVFGVGYRFVDH